MPKCPVCKEETRLITLCDDYWEYCDKCHKKYRLGEIEGKEDKNS